VNEEPTITTPANASYRPILALPYWHIIGTFIDEAVAETAAATGRQERSLYPAVSVFVLWCWQSRGTPLERRRIFRKTTVEEFVHLAMTGYSAGSRSTHRATLWLMVETLNPADLNRNHRSLPRSAPTAPYTRAEIATLRSWSLAQATERRQHDATALLALGLGAGLAARELLGVRRSDITDDAAEKICVINEATGEIVDNVVDDAGRLTVTVRGDRARNIPVLIEWAKPLRKILNDLNPDEWVFRPGRISATSGQVTDFLLRARTTLDIRPARMRTTWLLNHLHAGTPPHELLRISGLKNFAALDKIAVFASQEKNFKNFFDPTKAL
jgi:integrase